MKITSILAHICADPTFEPSDNDDHENWLDDSKDDVNQREECDVCSKSFKTQGRLKNHMKKFHGIETEIKSENDFSEVNNDEKPWLPTKSNAKRQPHTCTLCSKTFKGKKFLVNHMKKSHGNEAFEQEKKSER